MVRTRPRPRWLAVRYGLWWGAKAILLTMLASYPLFVLFEVVRSAIMFGNTDRLGFLWGGDLTYVCIPFLVALFQFLIPCLTGGALLSLLLRWYAHSHPSSAFTAILAGAGTGVAVALVGLCLPVVVAGQEYLIHEGKLRVDWVYVATTLTWGAMLYGWIGHKMARYYSGRDPYQWNA